LVLKASAARKSETIELETSVPKFHGGLCQMWDGQLPPYEAAIIEEDSVGEAIEAAKRWAQTVERREGAWLVIQNRRQIQPE
jgi:hypothetical protein